MTEPLFDSFRAHARARAALKQERLGQAYFNALYFDQFDPEFADQIRGTEHDPFHNDGVVQHLETMLKIRWQGQKSTAPGRQIDEDGTLNFYGDLLPEVSE